MESNQWPQGLKRTRPRALAWQLLLDAPLPLDAAELHRRMEAQAGPLALSTVYRVLSAFLAHGMVEKTTLPDRDTALYSPRRAEHAHYAICLRCRRQVPLAHCPLEQLAACGAPDGFAVTTHRLELYGYCKACQEQIK